MDTDVANTQLFVDQFDRIKTLIQKEISKENSYVIYSAPVSTESVVQTALKILEAMKKQHMATKLALSNSIFVEDPSIEIFAYEIRPLYSIFEKCGMKIGITEEIPPPDISLTCTADDLVKRTVQKITYTKPKFIVAFNQAFKEFLQKNAKN